MFKVALDAVNKSAQFKLKDNVSAVSLDILGNGGQKLDFQDIGENLNVRIELIRKNQPNVTLTDLSLFELTRVVNILYKGDVENTIPVAMGSNLILNDEAYLLVSLDWKTIEITKMDVFENRVLGETASPLAIKSVAIDEQTEVNTEFYTAVVFFDDIKSLETVKSDVGDDGVVVSQKQELTYDFMQLLSDEQNGVVFVTEADQKIKFFGAGNVYLVQV